MHINISVVDPFSTICGKHTIGTSGGGITAYVLTVCQCKAQVQRISVAQEIVRQTLAGIDRSANAVHPAGALGEVKFSQTVRIGLTGQCQIVLQDLVPKVFRDVRIVHQTASLDTAQIETHIRRPGIIEFIAVLRKHLHNGIGCRYILLDSIGIRLFQYAQTDCGRIQNDIGRSDLTTGVHKMIVKVIGIEGGITFLVPGPDRYCMMNHIAGFRIREVKLIFITGTTGRTGHQLAIQANFDIAGVEGFSGVCSGLHGKGEVAIAQLGHTLKIRKDGWRILTDSRILFVRLLCHIPQCVGNFLHGCISVFDIQSKEVGLVPAQCCFVVLAISGQVLAVLRGGTVAELYTQGEISAIDQVCVEWQYIVF